MRIHQIITVVLSVLVLASSADAATITKVKGKKVMVDTEGDDISSGDKLFAVDSNGKRKAIIKITKVKGEKALGEVRKGKAAPQMNLVKGKTKSEKSAARDSGGSASSLAVGGMLGYAMDSITATTSAGDVDMTGSGFGFDVIADYKLFSSIYLRGTLGYETFEATGDPQDFGPIVGVLTPTVSISFIKAGLMAQYAFLDSDTQIWGGLGFNFYSPSSSDANVLESVGGSGALVVAAGVNIPMGDSLFFPIQGEYNMFMGQADVSISIISLRAGCMFRF